VNGDHPDLARFFQPHIFPGLAAVGSFIDAISIAQCTLMVIFACAGPDNVVVPGIHRKAADRICAIIVEDRFERIAVIGSFPDVAAGDTHEIFVMIVRIYGKVGNTARGKGRPDTAEFQPANIAGFNGICDDRIFLFFFFFFFFFFLSHYQGTVKRKSNKENAES
jgi:hypothetical protein